MKKLTLIILLTITQLFGVTYNYDELNRLTKATYADGIVMHYSYDDGGNLLSVVSEGISIQDADGDGIPDDVESRLGLDPNSADSDGDGISDMDEVGDINHPLDTDNDGTIDALDSDSDNDGVLDKDEITQGTSPIKSDTDGDGANDAQDTFPLDKNETIDTDHDGTGDNADTDDDNDGIPDTQDSNSTNPDIPVLYGDQDLDGDGIVNGIDPDIDGDDVNNSEDAYPFDADKWQDTALSDISKEWIGVYRWTCGKAGFEPIRLSLRQFANSSTIEGNITIFGEVLPLVDSGRYTSIERNATSTMLNQNSPNGNYLYLRYDGTEKVVNNEYYLKIQNDSLSGSTLNGDASYNEVGGISSHGCSADYNNTGFVALVPLTEGRDSDGDGITDIDEMRLKLDIFNDDTDWDGIPDNEEVDTVDNPRDTDKDGAIDALDTDSDNDGMKDVDELRYGFDYTDPSDASQDSDGDGVSNLDEINAGTDPRVGTVATLTLAPMDDIYADIDTNMPLIRLEGNASNGAAVSFSAISSNTNVVIPVVNDNLLTLSSLYNTEGDANITVTMSAAGMSIEDTFRVIIRRFAIVTEQVSGYEPIVGNSHTEIFDDGELNALSDDNGHVLYSIEYAGVASRVYVNMTGGRIKINNDRSALIKLPTEKWVEVSVASDGKVEPYIEGMVMPSTKLPLGTKVQMDEHAVDIVLPLPDRLRF